MDSEYQLPTGLQILVTSGVPLAFRVILVITSSFYRFGYLRYLLYLRYLQLLHIPEINMENKDMGLLALHTLIISLLRNEKVPKMTESSVFNSPACGFVITIMRFNLSKLLPIDNDNKLLWPVIELYPSFCRGPQHMYREIC